MTNTVMSAPTGFGGPPVGDVLRSEWTKLRSVRSTYWTAIVGAVAAIGITVLGTLSFVHNFAPSDLEGFDAANFTLQGLYAAQLAIGALGVLTITGEYATGMIRTTLTAVPQRRMLLTLKGAVFCACTLVLGEVMSFASFGIGQAILHQRQAGVSLADAGVARAVIGGGLFLTLVGWLAFGLGSVFRRTAGALTAFFGVLFLPSALIDLLPHAWRANTMKYAPANAGTQILATHHQHGMLGPWSGLAVLALYAAIAFGAALFFIGRRDA